MTEIKEKQIFERIRWQLRIFESVFYKSLIRACSFGNFLAASQNARSNGQTSNHRHCEFVKNALKKCSCLPPGFFQIFVFLLFLSNTCKPTYKSESVYTNHCIMFPLHLVFNLLLKILHDLLWLIIFPIRNHKIKDHIRMCWPFDHSKVMN